MLRLSIAVVLIALVTSPLASQPAPSTGGTTSPETFLIVPGQSMGRVRLGMQLREAIAILGQPSSTEQNSDGTSNVQWYHEENEGIGAVVGPDSAVRELWALNDPRYATRDQLRAGNTEADIRALLKDPTRVKDLADRGDRVLEYDAQGIWFTINLDAKFRYFQNVYEIGVYRAR
jgi:hypothetical protein